MDKTRKKLSELHGWAENPRDISPESLERLKTQITELGLYKPLLITPEGEVIGGNMRFRALLELGVEDAWVRIVEPKTEAEKVAIALDDNDQIGEYDEQALAELVIDMTGIDLDTYHIDTGKATKLSYLAEQFGAGRVETRAEADVDTTKEKKVVYDANPNKQIVLYLLPDEMAEAEEMFAAAMSQLDTDREGVITNLIARYEGNSTEA